MEIDLLELTVVQEAPKSAHHPMIKIVVVLVHIPVDQIENPIEDPRTWPGRANQEKLTKEGDLVNIFLWAINACQLPTWRPLDGSPSSLHC
jgi:hypothetical protein